MKNILYLLILIVNSSVSSEYTNHPLSGHPNYKEPSTFPEFEVSLKDSVYMTEINSLMALSFCASVKPNSVVELDSGGGDVVAGYLVMQCIVDNNITVAVTNAASAATTIMLAGAKVCIHPDASLLYHTPFISNDEKKITKYELEWISETMRGRLQKLGYSLQQLDYIERFTRLSNSKSKLAEMPHGTMAGILGYRFVGYCKYVSGY